VHDLFSQRVVLKCSVCVRQLMKMFIARSPVSTCLYLCMALGSVPLLECSTQPFPASVCVCVSVMCFTKRSMFWPTVIASDLPRTAARGCERCRWGGGRVCGIEKSGGEVKGNSAVACSNQYGLKSVHCCMWTQPQIPFLRNLLQRCLTDC